MSLYTLIAGGKVAQTAPAPFPVNPVLLWADASDASPAPQPGWTATQAGITWTFTAPAAPSTDARPAAQLALAKSDVTMIRCFEHAIVVPSAWLAYRSALRAIVAGSDATAALPAMPAFPPGS